MTLIKCNWAVICQDDCCPHYRPHLTHPVNPYKHPQCEDKNTCCYVEGRAVNCVPVLGQVLSLPLMSWSNMEVKKRNEY